LYFVFNYTVLCPVILVFATEYATITTVCCNCKKSM